MNDMLKLDIGADGVARLTLARPEVHNALNGEMLSALHAILATLASDPAVRVLLLSGEGKSFCSGIDLRYQREQRGKDAAAQREEAGKFATFLSALDRFPKPVVGRINGSAFAGALGLIACCDIAIAVDSAMFALPEARLGLLPGMISPYVVRRIGPSAARRLILTARVIDAGEAVAMGLIDAAVPTDTLDAAVDRELDLLLRCAPGASAAGKRLVEFVSTHGPDVNFDHTIDSVAAMWRGEEAAEGIASFVEKRPPAWAPRAGSRREP